MAWLFSRRVVTKGFKSKWRVSSAPGACVSPACSDTCSPRPSLSPFPSPPTLLSVVLKEILAVNYYR